MVFYKLGGLRNNLVLYFTLSKIPVKLAHFYFGLNLDKVQFCDFLLKSESRFFLELRLGIVAIEELMQLLNTF